MKVIYIEANAEEMRANRTVLDTMTEVFDSITRAIANVDVKPEQVAEAVEQYNEQTNEEDDNG